jgi:hypothetical protein
VSTAFRKKFGSTLTVTQLTRVPGVLQRFVAYHVPERVKLNICTQFMTHTASCPLGRVRVTNTLLPRVPTLREFLTLEPLCHAYNTLKNTARCHESNSPLWTFRTFLHLRTRCVVNIYMILCVCVCVCVCQQCSLLVHSFALFLCLLMSSVLFGCV